MTVYSCKRQLCFRASNPVKSAFSKVFYLRCRLCFGVFYDAIWFNFSLLRPVVLVKYANG